LSYLEVKAPTEDNCSNMVFYAVTSSMDKILKSDLLFCAKSLPRAIIIDFCVVRVIDLTAMVASAEMIAETKKRGVSIVLINLHKGGVLSSLTKFGIKNHVFCRNGEHDLTNYVKQSDLETVLEEMTGSVASLEELNGLEPENINLETEIEMNSNFVKSEDSEV
jgi:MFS superfamily sulfate permease-like transporter